MMAMHRSLLAVVLMLTSGLAVAAEAQVTQYVRYTVAGGAPAYGILEGQSIRELTGDLFASPRATLKTVPLSEAKLLAPVTPSKVIAVGLNYRSHLGTSQPAAYPGLFAKMPTSIVGPEADIVIPAGARNVHYEGEVVVVIGRRAKNVSVADAPQYIFGITAGNDVSERDWQRDDLQWFRAKASDTFGPLGPVIVKGLNYNDVLLQTRLNGEVVQSQRTKDLIFDIPTIVSYISQFMTLEPGDVIYTGTPGTTRAMKAGDVVEIEVDGVGVLRNRVTAAPGS
jgi:2-keto-4-pentenoate hydratase/2-oxohepta-3-ene-1,7-dioic acid hydratase in catechol pathway